MKKILVVCALVTVIAGCSRMPENKPAVDTNTPIAENSAAHSSLFMDREFFERAFKGESQPAAKDAVIAGIIPHHLLASHLISRFFLGISGQAPSIVVVIGPNHFNNGNGPILSSKGDWSTPYGILPSASAVVDRLLASDTVKIDERVFEREHSISAEVSFIRRTFPNTTFMPIVLKNTVRIDAMTKLATALDKELPIDALVLASVDFSHEVTPAVADDQAEKNIAILRDQNIARVDDLVVDSKPTIRTLLEYSRLRQAPRTTVLESSNAAKVSGQDDLPEVTSYLTVYFSHPE